MEEKLGEVTAVGVNSLSDEDCRAIGLSRAKAEALRRVAEVVVGGQIDLDAICNIDGSEAIRELTAIKGVGRWTAEVYLLFCAGHPDVFPSGDVALQNAIGHGLGLELRPSAREIDSLAASWSPWRSVAARLFWAYYSQEMRRDAVPVTP